MRVHRLELTAFGPFAETQTVDFDALSDAGIFLLTGPTGSGKTSLLDAICFGLFGSVPGARNNAKDLKSHHADPAAVPVVELEVTLRQRRFRLRRTPAWRRPSRRAASGHVDEHAQARASELVDGQWQPLSARVDEVSHLVTRVLGMNREQFCQVVMLPQGQFQTFLRAGAKDRHDVLESLFETSRFQRIEKWLVQQRRARELRCHAHQAELDQLVARIEEAADERLLPPADGVTASSDAGAGRDALTAVLARLSASLDDLREREQRAREVAKQAQHALSEARTVAERQHRVRVARRNLEAIDATAGVVAERTELIARARRAAELVPLLDLGDEATAAHAHAQAEVLLHVDRLPTSVPRPPDSLELDAVAAWLEQVRHTHARVDSLTDVAADLATAEREAQQATVEGGRLALDTASAAAALEHLPTQLHDLRAERDLVGTACAALDEVRRAMGVTADVLAAAVEAARLAGTLPDAEATAEKLRRRHLDAKQAWLELRERYIADIAATLAGSLRPSHDCPVCGSREHPRPAAAGPGHVDAAAEAAALAATEATEASLREHLLQLEALRSHLATASHLSGGRTVREAELARAEAEAALAGALRARERRDLLTARIAEVEAEAAELARTHSVLVTRCAVTQTRLDQAQQVVERLRTKVEAVVGPTDTVPDRLAVLTTAGRVGEALVTALRRVEELGRESLLRSARAADALGSSDFADAGAVRDASWSRSDIATAEALNRAYADQRAVEIATVSDPQLLTAAALADPDLAGLAAAVEAAERDRTALSVSLRRLTERLDRLETLSVQLDAALAAWGPLRDARDLAVEVAALCAGTSADNATRTKLSHYVLSARLQQVVDAANVRLAGIAAGRYQLRHSMVRGVGDARGGLGLLAVDSHTGTQRDPATLSGGETFYVSLALALGLADLVRDEIGGVELSTLFVDEGFGSLDADTLDEVMDEIDSLRTGGRAVGLVSHLAELSNRVPARVLVVASPTGSRVVPGTG